MTAGTGSGSGASSAAGRILLVEDEEAIAQGLLLNLAREGYAVELAPDGRQALAKTAEGSYDLIVLDVRLPGIDGFEVCQRLRQDNDFTPVLMLTARSQPADVVTGLEAGADDYVVKPFDLAELLARIEGLLRRQAWADRRQQPEPAGVEEGEASAAAAAPAAPPGRLAFGPFWVDFATWQAETLKGQVELSQKEVAVMKVFAARPFQVITRRELLAEVWQLPDHPNTRVVDNVIVALRKAFEENSWRPRFIHSVRGVGYRFVPE